MAQFCYLSLYLGTETISCKDGRGLKDTPLEVALEVQSQGKAPWGRGC